MNYNINKKTIMLHGLNDDIISYFKNKDFKDYYFTFDDGLASLYKYKDFLKDIAENNKVIISVNPFIVNEACESEVNTDFIECFRAHDKIKYKSDFSHFLNLEMLKEIIYSHNNIKIGLHDCDHFLGITYKPEYSFINSGITRLHSTPEKLSLKMKEYQNRIMYQISWLYKNFPEEKENKIIYFTWPYNDERQFYKIAWRMFEKKENKKIIYFGKGRITGFWNYYKKDKNDRENEK